MELKDLVGPHKMLVAARTGVRHPLIDDKDGVAWFLQTEGIGDRIFMAFEDNNDGYRSQMGPLFVAHGDAYEIVEDPDYIRRNVVCRHLAKDSGDYSGECDILEIIDVVTGHTWLKVGTENIDDYYPSFVCVWSPMPPMAGGAAVKTA